MGLSAAAGGNAIDASLNEIEVMGKRAARGAGLPWGIAEEAGKALRWLTMFGFPGTQQLAAILSRHDGGEHQALTFEDGRWKASDGSMSPLIAGAALSDRARGIAKGEIIELGWTAEPLLLAPYVAVAAKSSEAVLALCFNETSLIPRADQLLIQGDPDGLTVGETAWVVCRPETRPCAFETVISPCPRSTFILDAEAWSRLDNLAKHTFAPATEASRQKGAGAGRSDDG